MLSNQVRQTFIDYFVRNGHRHVPSSSLIPYGDKTILFTNAGMNQFKNVFLGLEKRDYTRAVTVQKVMRVSGKHNDLENVGPSRRHHTFFEMLGNFSFGDYFKEDAMKFALELLEKEYGFPRERLWFTIYEEDDESFALWQKVGVKASRILRFGEKDNFWSMGPTGPCGPNSEIHFFSGKLEDNDARWVNNDNDPNETTVEVWNLVFMQFDRGEDGTLTPLPRPGVDTGMGFERLVRLLQGGESNYDSDLFLPLMDRLQALAGQTDAERKAHIVAYRAIADHARAAAFLIGDGVLPGNEGRNYVLRMIMRRAMRFGRQLSLRDPFLYQVADAVVDKMGDHYTELVNRREHILRTIHSEEERFARTLDQGLERLEAFIAEEGRGQTTIPGEVAFRLYDTYGLPLEITRDVAKEHGMAVDEAGFLAARQRAREIARAASQEKFAGDYDLAKAYREAFDALRADGKLGEGGVLYDPYGPLARESELIAILREGEMTTRAVPGERVEVVLRATPFYVESGGQVSDSGLICAYTDPTSDEEPAWCLAVKEMRRPTPELVVHVCEVKWGEPVVGDRCIAQADEARRRAIMRNHTATHLLQASLRAVLGHHVRQEGSLVTPDRLRFDFTHPRPLTQDELNQVADMLNDAILRNLPVTARHMPYQQAIAAGALAFFSEKYSDLVRVVTVGHDGEHPFSMELCGGTHVPMTGEIGCALLVSEGAVSAGVRRLEVLTGRAALDHARKQAQQIGEAARLLGVPPDHVVEQVGKLTAQLQEAQKKLEGARRELARQRFGEQMAQAELHNGAHVLVAQVQAEGPELMREMSDWYRQRYHSSVLVLGAVIGDKPALLAAVTPDLAKRGVDAGQIVRQLAPLIGGTGGGRPTLAQAGGKDANNLPAALDQARQIVLSLLANERA
jgi:alanyl-tRNA synthetase